MNIAILAPTHKSFICSLLPEYYELPDGSNGAPWVGSIISQLLKNGHKVTAITTTYSVHNFDVQTFKNENFTWIVVPSRPHSFRFNKSKLGRALDFFKLEQNSMVGVLRQVNPDIVHAFWSYEYAGAALKSGFPNIITVQDNAYVILKYFKNLYRFFRLLMSEIYLTKSKFATVPSPYMFKYVNSRAKNVKVIPNPVEISFRDVEIKKMINEKLGSIIYPKIIMIFNGWEARKNGLNALKAFKIFLRYYPSAILHLYGSGTEIYGDAYLDSLAIGLETNVVFHGLVPHKLVLDAINDAHVLVHPSREESFGVVLIEAMSRGVLVLGGINSGAVPWVINNDYLLVDIEKPTEIANKLFEVFSSENDYQNLSLSCYYNAQSRFSVGSVISTFENYYSEVISNSLLN